MTALVGRSVIETARKLVASALDQPNIYPQIRSDLMAIRNRLDGSDERAFLVGEQSDILDAYVGLARRRRSLSRSDEAALMELARQLA